MFTKESALEILKTNGIECTDYSINKNDVKKAIAILSKCTFASPMEVHDTEFGLDEVPKNLAMYTKLMKKDKKLVKTIDNYELYQSDRHIFMVNMDDARLKLVYLVQFDFDRINGLNTVSQIKLWRTRSDPKVTSMKLAKQVFFEIVMSLADGVASDNSQTEKGKWFWEERVAEAFPMGLNVYVADQNQKTFTKLKNSDVFDEKKSTIWGTEPKYTGIRLVITNKDLKEN